jgi:phosphate:Na+ symporter
MSLTDVKNLFGFIAGLGLFLYGMKILSAGLQKAAGEKMKSLLGAVTSKRGMAILVGALITAIIQSSGATTVMIVGFVNAGLMSLLQSVGVTMGANIGTTATAWLVSLDSLGETATYIKPSFYAPVMIGVGAAFVMFCKKHKQQNLGEIILSLGLLFFGLSTMSGSVETYMSSEAVHKAFLALGENPIMGLLIGFLVTTLMQSSSASVGVLQTLAVYGVVDAGTAVFVCLGANIGSTTTALLSASGASRDARRSAVINLLLNVFGTVIFGIIIFIFFKTRPGVQEFIMSSVAIAIFQTVYKTVNAIVFYPFAGKLVALSGMIVREDKPVPEQTGADGRVHDHSMRLDDRILNTPSLAIQAANNYIIELGNICLKNIERSLDACMYQKYELIPNIYDWEERIDDDTADLSDFLVKLTNSGLTDRQSLVVKNLMYTIIDLERIGDHAENMADYAKKMQEHKLSFSPQGMTDLLAMKDAVMGSLTNALEARTDGDLEKVKKTLEFEEKVDFYEDQLRENHVERLSRGECQSEAGVIYLNLVTNLERVSDHAVNMVGYVKSEADDRTRLRKEQTA